MCGGPYVYVYLIGLSTFMAFEVAHLWRRFVACVHGGDGRDLVSGG